MSEWQALSIARSDWQKQTSCLTTPLSWLSTLPRLSKLRRENNTTKSGQITEVEVKTKGKSNKDPWRAIQPLTWTTNTHNWLSEAKDQFVQENWTTLGQEKCWQQKILAWLLNKRREWPKPHWHGCQHQENWLPNAWAVWRKQMTRRTQAKNMNAKILDKNVTLMTCLTKPMAGSVKTNDKTENRWHEPKNLTGNVN